MLALDAGKFFDTLRCPTTLMPFTAAEGADAVARCRTGHC